MTTIERNIENALRSADDLSQLREYLRGMLDGGNINRDELALILRHAYEHFRKAGNDAPADLALDALDLVTGWCGPGMDVPEPHAA